MPTPTIAPYGAWKSPITTDLIVADVVHLQQIALDGRNVYWCEMRPQENGRCVVVRYTPEGGAHEVTPPAFNIRTRVHEYGGGAFAVHERTLYFSNFADQRLYRQRPNEQPQPLTTPGYRYADLRTDEVRHRLICVREDHTEPEREPANTIVAVDLHGQTSDTVLAEGYDFYAAPRLSPDGKRLAWQAWNHPEMPWTNSELWVAELTAQGEPINPQLLAGGNGESIFQPEWSPDGQLHFVSDRSDWWNLYVWRHGRVEPVSPREAEFGHPQWRFDVPTYGFTGDGRLLCSYTANGRWYLAEIERSSGRLLPWDLSYTSISDLRVGPDFIVFEAASPTEPATLVQVDLETKQVEVLHKSRQNTDTDGYLATPQPVEFPTEDGLTAHGIYYTPKNQDFRAPQDERPPLIVISHGGPTGATSSELHLEIQFWTSRGFAVLDVNYGGSTGYGRAYRERLDGRWGIVDVDDCVNGALYLANQEEVDRERLIIRGGSAGGYTTLAALAFRDAFKAGASYYGISELEAMAKETHKFESRYLDGLIGPYPQRRDLYQERSPLNYVEGLSTPIIFFQGLEDRVVPPNQAEMMVAALRAKGVPVAYVPFEGEQHGFRQAKNIKRALEAELYFYAQIFCFALAEPVEPVQIENFSEAASANSHSVR